MGIITETKVNTLKVILAALTSLCLPDALLPRDDISCREEGEDTSRFGSFSGPFLRGDLSPFIGDLWTSKIKSVI